MYKDKFGREIEPKDYILFTRSGSDYMELAQVQEISVKGNANILDVHGYSAKLMLTRSRRLIKVTDGFLKAFHESNQPTPVVPVVVEEKLDFLSI